MAKKSQKAALKAVNFFNSTYGVDDTHLTSWQQLCRDVGVAEGSSITKCKKNLKPPYINIKDFVEDMQAGRPPRTHRSYLALLQYTHQTERFFPLRLAKENKILKFLLVDM